jgi:hypothetical protein
MTESSNNIKQDGKEPQKGFINCIKCEYYFITWDPNMPRGCKVFKFKGREMPSVAVFKSTGVKCPTFKEKIKKG